ncbi:MAG: hypothetical protein ACXAB7_18750 [Candidatus Kariarchaeaceae archaeon]
MNVRECGGYLVFLDGTRVDAEIETWTSRGRRWYKGRGTIFLQLQNIPAKTDQKWQVGIFYCTKPQHNQERHVFSLTAVDAGSIIKREDEKTEKIAIDVAVTRFDDEQNTQSRPKITRD